MSDSATYPALLDAYLSARYLNRRTNQALCVGEAFAGLPPAPGLVHVQLSACNPASIKLTSCENEERTRRLAEHLNRLGLKTDPAISTAPDGSWPEESFWIEDVDCGMVDRLANAFGQNACLVVGADALVRLRLYLAAWQCFTDNDQRLQGLG